MASRLTNAKVSCLHSEQKVMTTLNKFDIEYPQAHFNQFVQDMENAGLEVRHYEGRFFFRGPAVVVDKIFDAMSRTKIESQWGHLGLQYIVYPRAEL